MKFISLFILTSIIFISCVKNENSNRMCQDGYCFELNHVIDSLRYDLVHYGDIEMKDYDVLQDAFYFKARKVIISNIDNDSIEIYHYLNFLQTKDIIWHCGNSDEIICSYACVYSYTPNLTTIYKGESKEFYMKFDLSPSKVSLNMKQCSIDSVETVIEGSFFNDGHGSYSENSMSITVPISEYNF